jgi:hypothetical protein
VFTRVHHPSLSWTRCIQSTPSHHVTSYFQVSLPTSCVHFLFYPCVLHGPPNSSSLILSP